MKPLISNHLTRPVHGYVRKIVASTVKNKETSRKVWKMRLVYKKQCFSPNSAFLMSYGNGIDHEAFSVCRCVLLLQSSFVRQTIFAQLKRPSIVSFSSFWFGENEQLCYLPHNQNRKPPRAHPLILTPMLVREEGLRL